MEPSLQNQAKRPSPAAALEARADEKTRLAAIAAQPKSPVKTLGVRASLVKSIARDVFSKARPALDDTLAIALVDALVLEWHGKRVHAAPAEALHVE